MYSSGKCEGFVGQQADYSVAAVGKKQWPSPTSAFSHYHVFPHAVSWFDCLLILLVVTTTPLAQAAQSPETEEAPAVEENGGDVGGGGSSGQGAGVVVDGSNTRKINGSTRRLSALPPETQPFTEVATTLGDGGKGELAKTANGNRIDTSSTANQLVRFEGGNGLHPQSNGGGVNSSNIDHPASRRRNAGREGKNTTRGVEVSADDVWEAFLSTRPSLSSEDRARYDSAYQKFRGGSRPADFNPVSSVDDGTLRTALK